MTDGMRPGARDYLDEAFDHAAEAAGRDGGLEMYHENREILSLFYSVAMSLADIADAMKVGTDAPNGANELPDSVTDGEGDRWARFAGTDRYGMTAQDTGRTLDEIRRLYGIRGEGESGGG